MGKGRAPCCDKSKVKKGPWSPAEDLRLIDFIQKHGFSNWRALPKQAGLLRCGKSCRLRWINYLRPDVKRGNFTPQEELTIINLHNSIGNKWSKIASYLPGRTDNEIKNVWNTHLKKRLKNDGKTNNSASPSCTSSSITTSDDQKIEKTNPDEGFQESETSKTNQNPENLKEIFTHPIEDHNEEKEHSVSNSPTSSYNTTNEALAFSRPGIINPGSYPDKIEIPFECDDIDIWELLDTLDPVQEDKSEQNGDNQGSNHSNYPGQEIDCNNWLRFLENELGLTSDPIDIPTNEMDFELEISPMWPCSPQNFSI